MILTCPQCATRYQADDSKFLPAGRSVKCARCGKVWHQAPPPPETETTVVLSEPQTASADAATKSGPRDLKPREGAFAQYSVIAAEMEDESSSGAWAARAVRMAGWAALVLIFASVGWASIHFREDVVALWPQSAALYKAVGLAVSPGGIDIIDVRNDLKVEDGARVLVVSGKLVNISGHELPVPQLRIALLDERERELFHWPVFAPAGTLMPGQSTRFLARLSDPPLAAAVQVTFAPSEP